MPKDIPAAANATDARGSTGVDPATGLTRSTLTYTVPGTVDSVAGFYMSSLPADGWSGAAVGWDPQHASATVSAHKSDHDFVGYLGSAAGVVQVTIIVKPKK